MSMRRDYPAIVLLALCAVIWMALPGSASGAYTDAATPVSVVELAPPGIDFFGAEADAATAFREEDAGFSAYYRVLEPPETAGAAPRLNIDAITRSLTNLPGESDLVRTFNRAGTLVAKGVNFGIVSVPMRAAVGQARAAPRDVTVYYDDQGWVIAYLPLGAPAAAIWRNRAAPGETAHNQMPDAHLEHNLLVAALNMVLRADDAEATAVTHATAGYYHWEYPDCNAFMMFSNKSQGGESHWIKFVIPSTISHIRASAAALITSGGIGGESTVAKVKVDGNAVATAPAPDYLVASKFDLIRNGEETSVHHMTVSVDAHKSAAGVVMLLYNKPAS